VNISSEKRILWAKVLDRVDEIAPLKGLKGEGHKGPPFSQVPCIRSILGKEGRTERRDLSLGGSGMQRTIYAGKRGQMRKELKNPNTVNFYVNVDKAVPGDRTGKKGGGASKGDVEHGVRLSQKLIGRTTRAGKSADRS